MCTGLGRVGVLLVSLTCGVSLWAQTPEPTTDTAPDPEQVQAQLLEQMSSAPSDAAAPVDSAQPTADPAAPPVAPSPAVEVDRAVVGPLPDLGDAAREAVRGVAPQGAEVQLLRDGEFIINRRGRLVVGSSGTQLLFAFEADGENSPEAPMVLQPCQMLQSMEELVKERGDRVVFIVSGQVYAYRGANFLLPTMMKLAADKGNLQP